MLLDSRVGDTVVRAIQPAAELMGQLVVSHIAHNVEPR